MPKSKVAVNVAISGPPTGKVATPNPDPVPVSKATNDGITWNMSTAGYEFTGVDFGGNASEFGTPTFSNANRTMTVTDNGDVGDYAYTIGFKDSATGEKFLFDPTIHNQA